jgi:hypothetical protein
VFALLPTGSRAFDLRCSADCNSVQPPTNCRLIANRSGGPNKGEKCGLKGVLGVGRVGEQVSADGPHHRPMPIEERGEGRFVACRSESADQIGVGPEIGPGLGPNGLADHSLECGSVHYHYVPAAARFLQAQER